jgi:hypothetical protein
MSEVGEAYVTNRRLLVTFEHGIDSLREFRRIFLVDAACINSYQVVPIVRSLSAEVDNFPIAGLCLDAKRFPILPIVVSNFFSVVSPIMRCYSVACWNVVR